jgi:hypothetical protein
VVRRTVLKTDQNAQILVKNQNNILEIFIVENVRKKNVKIEKQI